MDLGFIHKSLIHVEFLWFGEETHFICSSFSEVTSPLAKTIWYDIKIIAPAFFLFEIIVYVLPHLKKAFIVLIL